MRRFLGGRGKVNKGIQATLLSHPERFGLYNNGITLVVSDFERNGDSWSLVEPYIVNGCQTTRTIWEVCHTKLD
ncbi:MAG: AIPR family protein [Chloroflexi bacterium]|nr:AIPR family protein [Chloroflexota bacterium]